MERDSATGLDHTWFRKLESQAGRWTSPDPYKGSMSLGDPQSLNRYANVGNDPVNFIDPTGLCWGWYCVPRDPPPGPPPSTVDVIEPREVLIEGNMPTLGSINTTVRQQPIIPQNRLSTPRQIQKEFYRRYQKSFTRCLWKVFGGDANNIKRQTLRNAPDVNIQLTTVQIGGVGSNNPNLGPHGTVNITSDFVLGNGVNRTNAILGTYAHETANILDEHLNPKGAHGHPYGQSYGNPLDLIDRDTGAKVERCMFGALQHPEGINLP